MLKDLHELVDAGVITADTAAQINQYYQSKKDNSGNRFNTILGILGALLVGAGIVLVVAHNWDNLNRTLKTVFAFLPLVLGQALCAYTLFRKNNSTVWRESSAAILFFAVAATISMVSQVYQVSGSLHGFILTWLIMGAPLVYIMNASATSLMVIAAGTWYAQLVGYGYYAFEDSVPWNFLLILLFLAPHYYRLARTRHQGLWFHFHNWFLAISVMIVLAAFKEKTVWFQWGSVLYMALFSVFYIMGSLAFFRRKHILSNPFLICGLLGTLIILFIWTFPLSWSDLSPGGWGWDRYASAPVFLSTLLLMLLLAVALIIYHYYTTKKPSFDPVGFTAFLFMACILLNRQYLSMFVINCWVLLIAVFYIRKGNLQNHFGILNLGLLIILLLALMRFFDDNIPFLWRGVMFVLAGAGFFAANYLMLRKRKAVAQNNNA